MKLVLAVLMVLSQGAFAQSGPAPKLAEAFNWCGKDSNTYNKCTPVKSQLSCGSCWAFATTAVMENLIYLDRQATDAGAVVPDLSEQYMVSCNTHWYNAFIGGGCGGGTASFDMFTESFQPPHASYGGAVYEEDFPYTATNGTCNAVHTRHEKLKGWVDLPDWSDVRTIQEHILSFGPVYAQVCSDNDFAYHWNGTFHGSNCHLTNHAVVIVGWDNNNGDGYWIIRNSWGPWWGRQGYMHLAYGANDIESHVVAAHYKPKYPLPPTYGCLSTGDVAGFWIVVVVMLMCMMATLPKRK
jgi:C1A family cysteine protease